MLLSVAVSLDGYIDDASAERLLLSNAADFDRVDQIRAESDAILIGAETVLDGVAIATGYSRETMRRSMPKVRAEQARPRRSATRHGDRLQHAGAVLAARHREAAAVHRLDPAGQGCHRLAGTGDFVNCVGVQRLRQHDVEVVLLTDLAAEAMSMNQHLDLS